jgi:hypothetical protein
MKPDFQTQAKHVLVKGMERARLNRGEWPKLLAVALLFWAVRYNELKLNLRLSHPQTWADATTRPVALRTGGAGADADAAIFPLVANSAGALARTVANGDLAPFNDYIEHYKKVAIAEAKKNKMPASIKIAQAILESNAGRSRLAVENNNHFGIKCTEYGCLPGHCTNFMDDSHKDFFMKYKTVWDSYRDHSRFLHKDRYQALFKLAPNDYKGWAAGLEKAGYANSPDYGKKLVSLIERFKLYHLDSK